MEEIAATQAYAGFEKFDDFVETLGGECRGIEQEQRDVADDSARTYACNYDVRFGRLQDLRGVVGKDEAQKLGERGAIRGRVTEECGGAFAPGEDFWSGFRGEPTLFAEDGENVRR